MSDAPPWGYRGPLPIQDLPSELGRRFRRTMEVVARFEGGDVDHPDDPGGRTRWGITHHTWRAWLRSRREPQRDLATMHPAEAAEIYWERYWDAGLCHQLPWPAAMAHMDAMVQHGPGGRGPGGAVGATHLLQRALGEADDGIVGPRTRAAMDAADAGLLEHLLWERLLHYWRILDNRPTLRTFSRGWRNRVSHLRVESLSDMPRRIVVPPVQLTEIRPDDPRPLPVPKEIRRVA
jgi:lysozyme family protein